jgi:MATE family multidrug resistance protein
MRPDLLVWRKILMLAGPLILSMTANMVMQFIDGLFLARYSAEAVAAIGPAAMASFCIGSLVSGAVSYTCVLTAQYYGAAQWTRIGSAVWQGLRLSLVAGLLSAGLGLLGRPVFAWIGHAPQVQAYEVQYFAIISFGMGASFVGTALSGFFAGRGKMLTVMNIQFGAVVLNTVLAYGLVFGKLGLPEWGVAGAALATVVAQVFSAAVFLVAFLGKGNRLTFHTWQGRKRDGEMMARLLRFGLPNGFRFFMEICAWTSFLFFVGRIGTTELAATSIAWRINGVAFFPIVGLSEAVRVFVGQAQGRNDPHYSAHVTWQGLLLAEVWMVGTAALFILFPSEWYALFMGTEPGSEAVTKMGVVLLRYVAAYCLLDGVNILVCGALVAAGDTRWTLWVSVLSYGFFTAALFAADRWQLGLHVEWCMATVFVMVLALVWLGRFFSGRWRNIRVIGENDPLNSVP